MTDEASGVTLAFNGEIYNYRDLRRDLEADGIRFKTHGDTEVLLQMYVRHGQGALDELVGMFAVAVYDERRGTLLLARDRMGQKPLWYAPLADRVVFASEAKALLEHPGVAERVNAEAITFYLSVGYVPGDRCAYEGVLKVLPGQCVIAQSGKLRRQRYWQLRVEPARLGEAEALEAVRSELARAVQARLVSDVPLGVLLSGGIDSSIIVGLMARACGRAGGVRTFTAGFEDVQYDERSVARRVAEHFGTDHTELLIQPRAAELLDELVEMYDEPFGDSSALATWLICRAARERVTVALAGDGGDEVFGGYDRYRAMWLAQRMGPAAYLAARAAAGLIGRFGGGGERTWSARLVRFAKGLPLPYALQYFSYRRLFGPQELAWVLTDDFKRQVDLEAPQRWFCQLYEQGDFEDEVTRGQFHDVMTYLPDDLLVKSDTASMAASLELRAPMLDHRVVQLGLSLPVELKVGWGRQKLILRKAFEDLVPREVFRRRKRGFGVPIGRWLRGELLEPMRQTLLGRGLGQMGILRRAAMERLIESHTSGREDHSHRLWALLMLGRWLIRHG